MPLSFFAFPNPRSQRLPETNWRPPLNLLIVSRQLLVQPLHFAMLVSNCRELIWPIVSIVVAYPLA